MSCAFVSNFWGADYFSSLERKIGRLCARSLPIPKVYPQIGLVLRISGGKTGFRPQKRPVLWTEKGKMALGTQKGAFLCTAIDIFGGLTINSYLRI